MSKVHPAARIDSCCGDIRTEMAMLEHAIRGILTADDHAYLSDPGVSDSLTLAFEAAIGRVMAQIEELGACAEAIRTKGALSVIAGLRANLEALQPISGGAR